MERAFALAGLALVFTALTGCDQKSLKARNDASFDASDPKNAVEPAKFGAKTEPVWAAGPEPEASANAPSLKAAESLTAAPVDLSNGDPNGRKIFDGAGDAAPVAPPAPKAVAASGRAPVVFSNRKMSIDTDGIISDPALARSIAKRDPWRQNDTSYHYADGRPLDASKVPYIVLPLDYHGAQMGDLALVEYRGRQVWAVCGDRGPAGRFGEGSAAAAEALGINPDGIKGGVSRGVTYTLFPGTARRQRDQSSLLAYISDNAPSLYARLGRQAPTQLASR